MNVQAYMEASEQRLQLRRDLIERLQQVRDAANALRAAAVGVEPSNCAPRPEEPLALIDPLCAGARALTEMLQRNRLETAAAEQALVTARIKLQRMRLLAACLGALALLGVAAVLLLRFV